MVKKTLPTIDIKGKQYVLVKDRVLAFNEAFPNGSIQTRLISTPDSKTIVMQAVVTPDVAFPARYFADYSQAVIGQGTVNMTAAMENASTSAVGRALALMGIGVIDSIASVDEIKKAEAVVNICPKCGGKLLHDPRRTYCEHYKWDTLTKKSIGSCNYILWNRSG